MTVNENCVNIPLDGIGVGQIRRKCNGTERCILNYELVTMRNVSSVDSANDRFRARHKEAQRRAAVDLIKGGLEVSVKPSKG